MMILHIAGIVSLYFFLSLGFAAIFLALPGTMVIFLSTLIYAAATGFEEIGWRGLLVLLFMVAMAEVVEFLFCGFGALKFGGSKWGFWGSVIGAVVGGAVGGSLFFIVGAVPGLILGAFLGAFLAETAQRRKFEDAFTAGFGSAVGRVAATLIKAFIAIVMIAFITYMLIA